MEKITAVVVFIVFSSTCIAGEGIWQDKDDSARYYSIHEREDRVVLINLPGIETSGSTLKSAYIGNTSDYVLTRIEPDEAGQSIYDQVTLVFESPDDALIYPVCDVCSVVAIKIRRVF